MPINKGLAELHDDLSYEIERASKITYGSTVHQSCFLGTALDIQSEDRVLDAGCGVGRHAFVLAALTSSTIVGVDQCQRFIDTAQSDASLWTAPNPFTFVMGELASLASLSVCGENSFDKAYSMYTSFGYYDGHQQNQDTLSGIATVLKPGGRFLLDIQNTERAMQPRKAMKTEDYEDHFGKYTVVLQREFDQSSGKAIRKLERRKRMRDGVVEHCSDHKIWLYTPKQIEDMLTACGLSVIAIYGDYSSDAQRQRTLTADDKRCIVIAEKPR